MVSNINGLIECVNDDFKFFVDEVHLNLIKMTDTEYTIFSVKYGVFSVCRESPGQVTTLMLTIIIMN